ncbi:hypothetical protein EDB85DRAFT_6156 [Lactarius pseudohatsudake]|nr:hypothetical protein EDB85DRAFT_6156 [Lactarius pseudohatsudake]
MVSRTDPGPLPGISLSHFSEVGYRASSMVYVRSFYLNALMFQAQCAAKGSRPCNWKPRHPHIKANTSFRNLTSINALCQDFEADPEDLPSGLFEDVRGLRTNDDAQPPDPARGAPSSGFSFPTSTATHSPDRVFARHRSPRANRRSCGSRGTDCTDPLTHIRRAALDLLTLLCKLKECACRGSKGPSAWCSAADGSSRASRSSGMSWGGTQHCPRGAVR